MNIIYVILELGIMTFLSFILGFASEDGGIILLLCPCCAQFVQPEAKVCRYCGHSLDDTSCPAPEKVEPTEKP